MSLWGRLGGRGATVGDEALTIDLAGNGPEPGTIWFVRNATSKGWLSTSPFATDQQPLSGLFVVKYGQPPESLADGQSTSSPSPGVNLDARGDLIPSYMSIAGLASGYDFACVQEPSNPIVLPGETIRAVFSCNPGTAAPGPGALSYGVLSVVVEIVTIAQNKKTG